MSSAEELEAVEKAVDWLERRVARAGRGDDYSELDKRPDGVFWLGRLAPEARVERMDLGARGERLVGLRIEADQFLVVGDRRVPHRVEAEGGSPARIPGTVHRLDVPDRADPRHQHPTVACPGFFSDNTIVVVHVAALGNLQRIT